ncbi:hypothetical protein V5799_018982 [Amblyomma americanum]|uniref:lysozyme n=1 Tax=Amblyomma americanum TaxID=6943 RepID=A0AAQ4EY41_AMBAM
MRIHLSLVFLALVCSCRAKVYDRCELASILVGSGIPESQIPDWICLATAESSLDSNAINGNTDGSTDYGIFQHSSRTTSPHPCSVQKRSTSNKGSRRGTAGRTSAKDRTSPPMSVDAVTDPSAHSTLLHNLSEARQQNALSSITKNNVSS